MQFINPPLFFWFCANLHKFVQYLTLFVSVSGLSGTKKLLQDFLRDTPIPKSGPHFDMSSYSNNVTGLVGHTTYLRCRVRNLGNETVSALDSVVFTNWSRGVIVFTELFFFPFPSFTLITHASQNKWESFYFHFHWGSSSACHSDDDDALRSVNFRKNAAANFEISGKLSFYNIRDWLDSIKPTFRVSFTRS